MLPANTLGEAKRLGLVALAVLVMAQELCPSHINHSARQTCIPTAQGPWALRMVQLSLGQRGQTAPVPAAGGGSGLTSPHWQGTMGTSPCPRELCRPHRWS